MVAGGVPKGLQVLTKAEAESTTHTAHTHTRRLAHTTSTHTRNASSTHDQADATTNAGTFKRPKLQPTAATAATTMTAARMRTGPWDQEKQLIP